VEALPLDVVVVNWNGGELLWRCLDALAGQGAAAIAVVDNGSEAAERERLAATPGVTLLPLPSNEGFAPAANRGTLAGSPDRPYVALVNNDCVLLPGFLGRCVAALEEDPGLAAVQGAVLDASGERVDGCGIAWNARAEAVQIGHGGRPPEAGAPPFAIPGVSATAAVYRREALLSSGGFAGSFFAYYEDADLSLRLARAGWRFACVPAARALHEGSATGRRTPRARWRRLFANRQRTLRRNLAGALLLWPVSPGALLAASRDLGLAGALAAAAGGTLDALVALPEDRKARRSAPLLRRLPA